MNIVNGRPKYGLSLSIVVGLVCMLTTTTWADFQAGLDAYKRGDYEAALKEFRLAAEQGDAQAQFKLGVMYDEGQGVAQDFREAVPWFRQAAEQGHALAQNNLGVVYGKGQGVKQDYVIAHKWTNLASMQGYENAIKNLGFLEEMMTPAQIVEAQRLAREWTPKGKE